MITNSRNPAKALRAATIGLACVVLPAIAASAQSAPPMDSVPEKVDPPPTPAPTKSLSDKLDQSNGVIRPKEVDPEIEKPAPDTGGKGVIVPPGSQNGTPVPQPK